MSVQSLQAVLRQPRRASGIAAIVGAGVCVAGAAANFDVFLRSYLFAYLFWWTVSLGCLGGLMTYYLTDGNWGRAARPFLESGALTFPLILLAFLPVAVEIDHLYPWARATSDSQSLLEDQPTMTVNGDIPAAQAVHIAGDVREYYLNPRGFFARAAVYFVAWLGLTALVCRSGEQESGRPPRLRRVSAAGAPVLVLTCTFAAIDWGMSLESDWYSTMYGALFAIGAVLAGFALVTASAAYLQAKLRPQLQLTPRGTLADFGSLLLSFLMLWAYFAFSQFLIIWSGNLPEENVWYVHRLTGGWQWFGVVVMAFQFAVPLLLLLSRDLKRAPGWLAAVALLIFILQFVFVLWTILPAFYPAAVSLHVTDIAAPVALGGLWMFCYLSMLARRLPGPLPTESTP